jgi:hypothetical protein
MEVSNALNLEQPKALTALVTSTHDLEPLRLKKGEFQ